MTIGLNNIKSILTALFLTPGWALFSFIFASCSQISPVRYADFKDVEYGGMPQNWTYDFSPVPADSAEMLTKKFDAIIVVRYTARCPSKSVILNLEEFSLSHSKPDSLQASIMLFDNEGKPLGHGSYGVYEMADTIRRGISIPEGYSISVSSPLPMNSTAGINAVGVVLSYTGAEEDNLFNRFNYFKK